LRFGGMREGGQQSEVEKDFKIKFRWLPESISGYSSSSNLQTELFGIIRRDNKG
jgi:hypothetical protein